ncbi:MAG: molybdopterin oxidoreductase family protein [Alphaproteobacteria bacterium]|nr:molybdopterin oxidoreductase family protein [Alphaproteobacteria bacterium]
MDGSAAALGAPTEGFSACPHDCPSTCALRVELLGPDRIGRVHGAKDNSYTDGVICAKVARYADRIHHPDRLTQPMRRVGPKGSGRFEPISWDAALDEVAARFDAAEAEHGAESVWPYYFAGTMGLVMRDGIDRLRHVKRYSGMHQSICTMLAWPGVAAGTGALHGPDPREMADADVVVIWGTNAVHTQVNVMTHAIKARKTRGAKIVAIDVYDTPTLKQADVPVILRPGTDGALACAIMHVLFRDGYADRDYMAAYADDPDGLEAHLQSRGPDWASPITGMPVQEIEDLAKLIGSNKKTFLRLGYGFTRQRNGAVAMHAAASIATVMGSWKVKGGGAFHTNGAIFHWDKTLIQGLDARDPSVRVLDMSRIGEILQGDEEALFGGPPVTAMLIQNTNPMMVAPDLEKVHRGFAREDLFVCVHEQFMTQTAKMADIVLPATMFLEHDDVYQGGGHQHILFGPKLVEPPGECRSNHDLLVGLAERLRAEHEGFDMTPRQIVDQTLQRSGHGALEDLEKARWIDVQPDFEEAHYLNGFGHADGRFHFRADWSHHANNRFAPGGDVSDMPSLPDHYAVIEAATETYPFRLVTAPARNFLNSSFTETESSRTREGRPTVKLHSDDAADLGLLEGDRAALISPRGRVVIHVEFFDGVRRGVCIVESIWPNESFEDGKGINFLTGADPAGPQGGAAFHDNRIRIERA